MLVSFCSFVLAQEYDLKKYYELMKQHEWDADLEDLGIPPHAYLKDISGLLSPYNGVWVGSFGQYTYYFVINKKTYPAEYDKEYDEYINKIDKLSIYCWFFRKDRQGLRLVQIIRPYNKKFSFPSLKGDTYYGNKGGYGCIYKGSTTREFGELLLHLIDDNKKLKIRLRDYGMLGLLEGPQLFPVWYIDTGEYAVLERISGVGIHIRYPSKTVAITGNEKLSTAVDGLTVASYLLPDRDYRSSLRPWFVSSLSYDVSVDIMEHCTEIVYPMGPWLGKKGKRLGKETVCYPESLIPEEEGSREAGYVTYKDGKYILKYSQYVSQHSKPRIGYHRDNKLYSFEDIVAYTCRLILHADLINSYAVEKGIAEEVCTQIYGRN